jgi:hypothetical protein
VCWRIISNLTYTKKITMITKTIICCCCQHYLTPNSKELSISSPTSNDVKTKKYRKNRICGSHSCDYEYFSLSATMPFSPLNANLHFGRRSHLNLQGWTLSHEETNMKCVENRALKLWRCKEHILEECWLTLNWIRGAISPKSGPSDTKIN